MTIIECVPNFSEGRNSETLSQIRTLLGEQSDIYLLGSEAGESVNRSVFTFVGESDKMITAAYAAISKASKLIDMRIQSGEHPRIGACDVCPFIPLNQTSESMEVCVDASRKLGKLVGEELGIPVFLYGEAASHVDRRELAALRRGGYEGLQEKMQDKNYFPDFGPNQFNPRSGATVIGARPILVAYNISLDTTSRKVAQHVAKQIRVSNGAQTGLKAIKAMGWVIEDDNFKCAQVSMNLMDYKTTGLYEVFQRVKAEAESLDVKVLGSEVVGLVPLEALLNTARRSGKAYQDAPERELVARAIDFLGLNRHYSFVPEAKILDYALKAVPELSSLQ